MIRIIVCLCAVMVMAFYVGTFLGQPDVATASLPLPPDNTAGVLSTSEPVSSTEGRLSLCQEVHCDPGPLMGGETIAAGLRPSKNMLAISLVVHAEATVVDVSDKPPNSRESVSVH